MMSGDCQSQGLAEWLQALGWNERLKHTDLRKLNTPKMRSVWRHLQAQVMHTNIASTIRKNVLLNRLEKENIYFGQFRNFTLDSVNQLHEVKEILKIEEEKDKIIEEIKAIDDKLKNEKFSLLQKITVREWEINKLSEIDTKTTILDLKLSKFSKDRKKFNVDKETAETLKSCKNCTSYSELSHQKYMVCNYVKNYRFPLKDSDDDSEYICEMMSSILEFKSDNILDGITRIAKEALKSLHNMVDTSANLEDENSKQIITFEEKLRDLKVLVIKKKQNVLRSHEKQIFDSNELQKEKEELIKTFTELYRVSDEETESAVNKFVKGKCQLQKTNGEVDEDNKDARKLLNDLLERIKKERKEEKICEEKNLLMSDEDFEMLHNLRQSASTLSTNVNEEWKTVQNKVNEFNTVTSTIFSLLDSAALNELVAETTQLASDFKTETNEAFKKTVDCTEFTDMIYKEIEVFQRIPLVALQRKWDTSNEMLRICSTKRFSSNPSLLLFLFKAEEKDIITNVLENYLWSLYINPQFH